MKLCGTESMTLTFTENITENLKITDTFTRDDNNAITYPAGRTRRLITAADDGYGYATHRYASHENGNIHYNNHT
jgi:hypothetical protein